MGLCVSISREREDWNKNNKKRTTSERRKGCLAMAREQRSRFYILRRCMVMLLCWHKPGGSKGSDCAVTDFLSFQGLGLRITTLTPNNYQTTSYVLFEGTPQARSTTPEAQRMIHRLAQQLIEYNISVLALPPGLKPDTYGASPPWLNKADNAWELVAAALVGLQSVPGLIILYGSMVKKKWAVNSAFMALYAFAAVLICWVLWAHHMSFGSRMSPLLGKPESALEEAYLVEQFKAGYYLPNAVYVFYQSAFAAITVILLAGSVLGRMNFNAWMLFVPLWVTFSYTIGAFTIWGDGFLERKGIIDFSGGYVIHLSSGVAGFTAAYWVGPRHSHDRQHFPPNNIIHMLGGAGFLWLGWTGFNGGSPLAAGVITSLAILNTHLCTATSLIIWLSLDMVVYKKSSVIGAVQGMITGLVCITPGAGIVEPWAAVLMGVMSGSIPWYTMMVLHKRSAFFQQVDDTLGAFHTHAVAGALGGLLSGLLAKPALLRKFYGNDHKYGPGLFYSIFDGNLKFHDGLPQMAFQIYGALFITVWNAVITTMICLFIGRIVNLRMNEEDLEIGDDAVHGEEAYALWGDGERMPMPLRLRMNPRIPSLC